MASGHIVIRIREQPLPAITPHDIIWTPDQQADAIAELVHRKIVEVTPESVLAPSDDPEPAEATQLQLLPDDTPTFKVGDSHVRSQAQRIALKALMMEALLQVHTVSVNFDRTLGEHLLCCRSVRDVETVLRQDMGGLLALSHAARRTLGPIPPDMGTAHPPGQPD
ncbi:hypothetical protein ACWEKU_12500 [Streptomyces californicus]